MNNLKINETPVRTSKSFNINNIKLENVNIPNKIDDFENTDISNESNKINISDNIEKFNLTYGLGNFLTKQVVENSNKNINIDINCKDFKNVKINNFFDNDNLNLIDNIKITANENTKSNLFFRYKSDENVEAYHNGIMRILAKSNSVTNIFIFNLVSEISNNYFSIEAQIEDSAKVNVLIVDFGGKNSVTNYYSNLIGDLSDNSLKTIYIGKNERLIDLNYISELRGKKSNINIDVQGALKDHSKKHFKGTIDFKKGCKKATGDENENCMLLSNKAKAIALPMLLCSEEDVEGNHSSSAGKVGEKELFYIMSRGFDFKEAMKLMVRAKFNKILEDIKQEDLKNEVLDEINEKLD